MAVWCLCWCDLPFLFLVVVSLLVSWQETETSPELRGRVCGSVPVPVRCSVVLFAVAIALVRVRALCVGVASAAYSEAE